MARARANRLTLYLEGDMITAERFQRAVAAFFGILDDVAAKVTGDKKSIRWIVSAKEGSFGIVCDPMPTHPTVPVARIVEAIHKGMDQLEHRAKRPSSFSDDALRGMKELATVTDGREVTRARVVHARRTAVVRQETGVHVDRILGDRLRDYGSIEGQLQMVSIRGGPHFAVADDLTGKSIQCSVAPEQLDQALGAFRRRVSISGPIRYSEAGEAFSIDAERIDILPDDNDLPTADDVYGILSKV